MRVVKITRLVPARLKAITAHLLPTTEIDRERTTVEQTVTAPISTNQT